MPNARQSMSKNFTFVYMISACITISTVVFLRFGLAPVVEHQGQWSVQVVEAAPVNTLSVQQKIDIGSLGRFGPPLELPGNLDTEKPTPNFVVQAPVQDEASVQWSELLPALQTVAYHFSSAPKLTTLGQMRVGITNELETVQVSANTPLTIKDQDNLVLAVVAKHEVVTITPGENNYSVTTSAGIFSATTVKCIPRGGGVVKVENYENRPEWNSEINDNRFRGRILVARGSDSSTWVVNVLKLGPYVRGIAEASDSSPVEYQKALAIAARTYAVYNMQNPSKHAGEPYILNNTSNDQVYRGYGLEKRADQWAASARATMRQILTYDGEVIVAPYFSQSDGRTRSWAEVWGEDKPWAVSVPDPGCDGLKLKGHGVGMSGKGGVYFAEQGYTFDQILEYYYTGVSLETLAD